MDLIYQSHSPYARKVLVFAHEAGLAGQLRVIHHETSPTKRNEAVFALNPLGKVPVLVLPDGFALIESGVICDYLDGLGSRRLIPESGHPRWSALRLQALAQGLCDAGIALRWETERRPEAAALSAAGGGPEAKLIESYDFIEREAELEGRSISARSHTGDGAGLAGVPGIAGFRRGSAAPGALVPGILRKAIDEGDGLCRADA